MAKNKRFRSRRSRVALAVVSIAVLALAAFLIYRGVTGDVQAAVTYTTATVQKMTLISSIDGTGNVELPDTASVIPTVSGEVSGLAVEVGDTVETGQVLFTLVNPRLDVAVAEAQNAYDKALLAVDVAKLDLTAAKKSLADLYDSYHTTLQLKQAKAAVTSAELAVTAAENAVKSAEIALAQAEDDAAARTVTAPISGVVTAVSVKDGDTVGGSAGGAALTITDPDVYQAAITLAESDIGQVEVGQRAVLTFDALPDLTQIGHVSRVDTTGTNESGVVSYKVVITPEVMDGSVKGGMTVSVNIITDVAEDVLVVPSAAVKSSAEGTYVQVLQDGRPVNVAVEVGMSNDSFTEITSGLTEGQEIITATTTSSGGTTSTTTRGQPGVLEGGGFIMDGGGTPPGDFPSGGGVPPIPGQ